MRQKLLSLFLALFLVSQCVQAPPAAAVEMAFISAPTALLLDQTSNRVLYAKTPHLRRAPASTTKLLTAIVALHLMEPGDVITIPPGASSMPPSKIYVRAGEKYRVRDLINALLINSANDVAAAIAIAASGSFAEFSKEMNKMAESLGCLDSNFTNPSGLPDSRQYSSVYDMTLIMRETQRYPVIVQALKTRTMVIQNLNGRRIYLKNHNKMLWRDSREILGKTGWTQTAKHCFVGEISVMGKKVFVALLGSHRLWRDLKALADYQFGYALVKAYNSEKLAARENNRKIQKALKKAGFYHGAIDGKMGFASRLAIKKFQKANHVRRTGTVGPKTWQLLKNYL